MLVDEVVSFLVGATSWSRPHIYVDCTIGTGEHTKAILEKSNDPLSWVPRSQKLKVKIYGIDKDVESLKIARENLTEFKNNVEFIHGNFKDLKTVIKEKEARLGVDGVLFDLGMSSFQLEDPERGFGYKFDGEIDMRMDRTEGIPCFEMLNGLKEARFFGEKEIKEIIEDFGEERFAKRIARSIYNALPMKTTFELKDSILRVIPYQKHGKTLSRVFQAFRIKVNDELLNLKQGLESAVEILKSGGRIVCISYHSLEDRIVKWFFKENEHLMVLTKKPIRPSFEEVKINRRARSAKLRVAEKIIDG